MNQPSFIKKIQHIIRERPLIAGTLVGSAPLAAQMKKAVSAPVDLVEVRLDTFPSAESSSKNLIKEIQRRTRKPILLTLRSYTECGGRVPASKRWNDAKRTAVLKPLLPLVQLLDVEIRHRPFAKAMTALAHKKRVSVIHSVHDFSGFRRWPEITRLAKLSRSWRGDFFKVAVSPKNESELMRFLRLGFELKSPRKILIGMGKPGLMSRVLGFSFESLITYGHLGTKAAPGQLPVAALVKSVNEIYGKKTAR